MDTPKSLVCLWQTHVEHKHTGDTPTCVPQFVERKNKNFKNPYILDMFLKILIVAIYF